MKPPDLGTFQCGVRGHVPTLGGRECPSGRIGCQAPGGELVTIEAISLWNVPTASGRLSDAGQAAGCREPLPRGNRRDELGAYRRKCQLWPLSELTMPESKADRTRHANEEILNFLQCGDARGPRWLELHPDARAQAEQNRRELTGSAHEQT
jgi:hypothetical protein